MSFPGLDRRRQRHPVPSVTRPSVKAETALLAERLEAEGVFVLAMLGGVGQSNVRSSFTGTPAAGMQLTNMLRAMADDYDRKMGRR